MWSCYGCNYLGLETKTVDGAETCPECGCQEGDGFGMAENDPRYRESLKALDARTRESQTQIADKILDGTIAPEPTPRDKPEDPLEWEGLKR